MFSENSDFVSASNLQSMDDVIWEVHPAYRSYMIKIREDKEAAKKVSLSSFFSKKKK